MWTSQWVDPPLGWKRPGIARALNGLASYIGIVVTSIDVIDVGSGQITVKERRDGLFELPDMTSNVLHQPLNNARAPQNENTRFV